MVQFFFFFLRCSNYTWYYLAFFLNHIFLKYVMISIYIYIYIYDLEFNWLLDLLNFAPNKLLATKIKNLIDTWQKIELELKSNLESNWI